MSSQMPACMVTERLYALVDGALPPDQEADVLVHVSTCDRCRAELASARDLAQIAGRLSRNQLNSRDLQRIERCTQLTLEELRRAPAHEDSSVPPEIL